MNLNSRPLPDGSFVAGRLPISCVMCQQGSKMVLLVTGICGQDCFYCPLSLEKQGRQVVYANEKPVESDDDVISEAESIGARGTGITGGDPLLVIDQTVHYIRLLKGHFGPRHNIHLYTATPDIAKVEMLAAAGLDEIRFHPPPDVWSDLDGTRFPGAIRAARQSGMRTGLEIPAIPGMENEMVALALSARGHGAEFINLNELEFSESNWQALRARDFRVKDDVSSAVAGSQEAAAEVAGRLAGTGMIVHYCSSSFKDATQLRNRIMRRARNTATPLEIITDDGTFLKGVIETAEPGRVLDILAGEYDVPPELARFDASKKRVEVAAWILEELPRIPGCEYFIVEEYPTADRLEVERRRL